MIDKDIKPFSKTVYLASPTMHGDELRYMERAYTTNWMSTLGENIDEIEKSICEKTGCRYAVALSCGTAALHLAVKIASEKLYGKSSLKPLAGKTVFCSDMTFAATVNPVVYEDGVPVFIDTERDTWNMNPDALERAFELYPDTKLVVAAHLYGTPGKIGKIKEICDSHGALLIEDAAESLGASYKGRQTGTFGDFNVISFNGNKIITGSSGGMLITDSEEARVKAKKWSTQSREGAEWYQHEDLGFNYRMSNVVAGVVRGQIPYLEEHIARKKEIYERYKEGLNGLPVSMNPYDGENSAPNFWLSCILIDRDAMCEEQRGDLDYTYTSIPGKSSPMAIFDALKKYNAQSRPIWKPMHLQPIYKNNPFVTAASDDVGKDIFSRGLCLPSDVKMTDEEQNVIVEVIKKCFD